MKWYFYSSRKANIFKWSLQQDGARDSWGSKLDRASTLGPCRPVKPHPEEEVEWQWWCSRRLGSGLHVPTFFTDSASHLPRVLSECVVSHEIPPWKVASWSNTPRAFTSYKVLMDWWQGAAVVWKPCPHHSLCFVFSPVSLCLLSFSEHSEELTSWDHWDTGISVLNLLLNTYRQIFSFCSKKLELTSNFAVVLLLKFWAEWGPVVGYFKGHPSCSELWA